jgi:subtilisin family serine protease
MASGIPGNMNLPKLHTNFGAKSVQIAAPGLQESQPQGDVFKLTSSDMAAPVVSGVVAQMLTANPDLTPQDIKTILLDSAKDGVVDNKAALQASVNHAPVHLSMEEVSGVGLINSSFSSDQGLGLTGLNSLSSVVASGRFEGLGGAYSDKQMAKR